MAARTPGRVEPVSEFPAPEPRKLLSARIVALGAIPIAVFCGVYVLMRAALGSDNITALLLRFEQQSGLQSLMKKINPGNTPKWQDSF